MSTSHKCQYEVDDLTLTVLEHLSLLSSSNIPKYDLAIVTTGDGHLSINVKLHLTYMVASYLHSEMPYMEETTSRMINYTVSIQAIN